MALFTASGTITIPGSTGSSSTTGLGFQPRFVLFFYNTTTAAGSLADANFGYGVCDYNMNQWSLNSSSQHNVNPSNTGFGRSLVSAIRLDSYSQAIVYQGALTSFDSDGFTINWTTVSSGVQIHYLALGGREMDVKVGSVNKATVTGNQAVTGIGFKPNGLLFGNDRGGGSTNGGHSYMGIGAATSSSTRWSQFFTDQDGAVTAKASRYQRTAEAISIQSSGGSTPIDDADFVSMDSDGFTINWTVNSGSNIAIGYVAFRGINVGVGSFTQKTTTGSQATTGVGFLPKAIILSSYNTTAQTTAQSHARLSFGVGLSSSNRRCVFSGAQSVSPPTVDSQDTDVTKIIKLMTEAGASPTTQAAADLTSFDSDGFTLNWTTADATAREILYLALGQAFDGNFFDMF